MKRREIQSLIELGQGVFWFMGEGIVKFVPGVGGDSGGQVVEVRKGIENLRAFPMRDWLTFVLVKNVKILF